MSTTTHITSDFTPEDPRLDVSLSLAAVQSIDSCCERFEEQWRRGVSPEIAPFLEEHPVEHRSALLRELLAIDLEYRAARGETPDCSRLLTEFPQFAAVVEFACREHRGTAREDELPELLREHPRYQVERWLGCGGMGTVYAGTHIVLQRKVAIKIMRPELFADPASCERFLAEARALALLNHPHIVTVHDAEADERGQLLVMELLEGADVASVVREDGPLPVEVACEIIRQAAAGLDAAHRAALVHRDLSPKNLMLLPDGTIKLLDFGLALGATIPSDEGEPVIVGNLDYMAPEQAADARRADARSDLYSLGCVLVYLLMGKPPFSGGSPIDRLQSHQQESPARLDELRSDVPVEVADIAERLLAKDPAARFPDARSVMAALAPHCPAWNEEPAAVVETAAPVPALPARLDTPPALAAMPVSPVPNKPRARWWIAASLILATVGFALWRTKQPGAPQPDRPPENSPAQRKYREALHLIGQRQEKQIRLAIERLNAAVAEQPDFGEAHAALAWAHDLCGDYGWSDAREAFPLAMAAARESLRLDPDLAEGHLALALAYHEYEGNWDEAERSYRRALELKPDLAAAHHWYAWFLAEQGQAKSALAEILRARDLAPDDLIIVNNVGRLHYYNRQFSEAAREHRYALELDPDFRKAHLDLGYVLIELGQIDESLECFSNAAGLSERNDDVQVAQAYAQARRGEVAAARQLLAEFNSAGEGASLAIEVAHVYSALGEIDEAQQWLELAVERRAPGRCGIGVDPRFSPLQQDPRFRQLVRQHTPRANE